MLLLARLRIAAHRWGINAIRMENQYLVLSTVQRLIRQLAAAGGRRLRWSKESAISLSPKTLRIQTKSWPN